MSPARRRRGGFYAEGVPGPAERSEGGAEEWAEDVVGVMRARVAELMRGRPEDVGLLLKSAQALLRSALAERKLSGRGRPDLANNVRRVLDELGEQLLPGDGEGAGE